jgi:hypothetical protein
MKGKTFDSAVRLIPVLLLAGSIAWAQDSTPQSLSGVINAYSTQITKNGVTTGPYEVRGPWSIKLRANGTKASFSAALNMGESDSWVLTQTPVSLDPAARGAHTHHITLVGGTVTQTATGFQITGTATVTLNGGPAPISPAPLTIEVTGSTEVQFSNITLTFGAPADGHFGDEPLTGVVRCVKRSK